MSERAPRMLQLLHARARATLISRDRFAADTVTHYIHSHVTTSYPGNGSQVCMLTSPEENQSTGHVLIYLKTPS